jgi:hypothetical protein
MVRGTNPWFAGPPSPSAMLKLVLCTLLLLGRPSTVLGDYAHVGTLVNTSRTAAKGMRLYDRFAFLEPRQEEVCPDPGGGKWLLITASRAHMPNRYFKRFVRGQRPAAVLGSTV